MVYSQPFRISSLNTPWKKTKNLETCDLLEEVRHGAHQPGADPIALDQSARSLIIEVKGD